MENFKQDRCSCGYPSVWRNISNDKVYCCDVCKNRQCSRCPYYKKCGGNSCWNLKE